MDLSVSTAKTIHKMMSIKYQPFPNQQTGPSNSTDSSLKPSIRTQVYLPAILERLNSF